MIRRYIDNEPQVSAACFIADSADVIGDVVAGKDVSIWYHATLRGDNARITLGDRSNVQDNAVIHVNPGEPVTIGSDVTIGHGAIIHACTIGNRCIIGMGAIILDNAIIPDDSLVAAGALVAPGKTFPPGSLIVGSPARALKKLEEEHLNMLVHNADHYVDIAMKHRDSSKQG